MSRNEPTYRPQAAFFDHAYAVVDAETASAIERSAYLPAFGRFTVQTTVADAGESWKGRYLFGRRTYLELFGPDDLQGSDEAVGSTGIGLSPRGVGSLRVVTERLSQEGVADAEVGQRTREDGDQQIPWFDFVSPRDKPETFAIWVMEYLQRSSNGRRGEPAVGGRASETRDPLRGDEEQLLRDVSYVEIATTARDVAAARPVLAAAGFAVTDMAESLVAEDAETTIHLDAVARDAARLRRIEFALTSSAANVHVEAIGRSTLTVGSGDRAVWDFVVD